MSVPYQSSFFVVPSRIMNLPDLILSYLRIYETIFQFWNHGKNCYLSNAAIMERTGISSESTLREAFMYFENKGELIRRKKGGKRYFIQPERMIEIDDDPVDKSKIDSIKSVHTVAKSTEHRRQVDAPTVAKSTHNNKKINNKNIRESTERKKRVPLPENFDPNQEARALANKKGLDVMRVLTKFRQHSKSEGWRKVDWQEAFMKWLMDEREIKPIFASNVKIINNVVNETKSNVKWFNDNH